MHQNHKNLTKIYLNWHCNIYFYERIYYMCNGKKTWEPNKDGLYNIV